MDMMIYNGQEYELAPKTMKIARLQEKAEMSTTITEAYTNEFEFVKACIGESAVNEILGTCNIEAVDLNEMVLVYNEIVTAYDKEITEAKNRQDAEIFNSPVFDKISALAKDVETFSNIEKMGKPKKRK